MQSLRNNRSTQTARIGENESERVQKRAEKGSRGGRFHSRLFQTRCLTSKSEGGHRWSSFSTQHAFDAGPRAVRFRDLAEFFSEPALTAIPCRSTFNSCVFLLHKSLLTFPSGTPTHLMPSCLDCAFEANHGDKSSFSITQCWLLLSRNLVKIC
jgi:hypothetical protein